jgi:hypothetical protein
MKFMYQLPWLAVVVLSSAAPARAAERNPGAELSTSGGIADGSATGADDENPANLTRANGAAVVGGLRSGADDSLGSPTLRAGLLYGSGTFGVAAGVSHATLGEGSTGAYYGLGVRAEAIETSVGISGHTAISPSGGTSFDVGTRTMLSSQLSLGAVVYDLGGGPSAFGAGLGYLVNQSFSLVSDLTSNKDFKQIQAQPGLSVHSEQASLTVSYGFRLDSSAAFLGPLSDGWSLGAGLHPNKNFSFELYYNHLAKYAFAVTTTF